jgi:2-methylcitrate dehydratase PrpD
VGAAGGRSGARLQRACIRDADVVAIGVEGFREAIDLGSQCRYPATTDEAQYSLAYAVRRRSFTGGLAPAVDASALADPRVTRLIDAMSLAKTRNSPAAFPPSAGPACRFAMAARSSPSRAAAAIPRIPDRRRTAQRPRAGRSRAGPRERRVEALVDALPRDDAALGAG